MAFCCARRPVPRGRPPLSARRTPGAAALLKKSAYCPKKGFVMRFTLFIFLQFKLQKRQKINELLQKNIAIFGSMWYSLNGYQSDFIILFGNYKIPIKSK